MGSSPNLGLGWVRVPAQGFKSQSEVRGFTGPVPGPYITCSSHVSLVSFYLESQFVFVFHASDTFEE